MQSTLPSELKVQAIPALAGLALSRIDATGRAAAISNFKRICAAVMIRNYP